MVTVVTLFALKPHRRVYVGLNLTTISTVTTVIIHPEKERKPGAGVSGVLSRTIEKLSEFRRIS